MCMMTWAKLKNCDFCAIVYVWLPVFGKSCVFSTVKLRAIVCIHSVRNTVTCEMVFCHVDDCQRVGLCVKACWLPSSHWMHLQLPNSCCLQSCTCLEPLYSMVGWATRALTAALSAVLFGTLLRDCNYSLLPWLDPSYQAKTKHLWPV